MTKVKVNLNDVNKIKDFIATVRSFVSDVDIITDRTIFDGKSIMGLFSADLSENVYARIISDNEEEIEKFKEKMKQFQ